MEKIASEMMGEQVSVGAIIASRGHLSKVVLGSLVGGVVGGAVAGALQSRQAPSVPGNHQGLVYVAVGPTKVAFFSVKQGFFKTSIEKLLVEHQKSDVAAMDVKGGVYPKIDLTLTNGTHYALECSQMLRRKVNKVQEALGKQA